MPIEDLDVTIDDLDVTIRTTYGFEVRVGQLKDEDNRDDPRSFCEV